MPNFCGCTGESSSGKLHWPWRKQTVNTESTSRRSANLNESIDDADVVKTPTLAKPEVDDITSIRNSTHHEVCKTPRPPVTFELDTSAKEEEKYQARYPGVRNHSLDIDVANMDMPSAANRTFPSFFSSKSVRTTRLHPNHNSIVLRRGSLLARSARTHPSTILINQQTSADSSKVGTPGPITASQPSPSVGEGSHTGKERFLDESVIVTPFAQILAGLRSVQSNIAWLSSQKQQLQQASKTSGADNDSSRKMPTSGSSMDEDFETLADSTQKELEWCLQQLENIQTKRPVSDMASTKFKRLLSQKLGNFSSADKSQNQISEYISKTFMDEFSEQDDNEEEEGRYSSNAMATGSEAMDNSRTDMTGFSLDSSAETGDQKSAKRTSKDENPASAGDGLMPESPLTPGESDGEGLKFSASRNSENPPYLGITTPDDEAVKKELDASLDSWGLNMFTVDTLSGQHALTVVAYRIFSNRGLFHLFNIDPATFVVYILRLESAYHSTNPYHNHIHGADVLQAVHVLLQAETLEHVFSDLEVLSSLFASAIHDVNHPGLTNQFLVNTGHKLALLYNDASVLENHHLSVAFKLLTEPGCDIFANLTVKQRQFLRRLVIELVLATDMSKHMNLLAELRTMVETKELTGTGYLSLDDHNDRSLVLQCMLHCADLNSPTKPFEIYKRWTFGVMEEFFKQGDKEKELGIEVSAMCDRESVDVDKAQIGFIDFIIHPLWDTWCDLVHPASEHILEALDTNRDIILNQSPFKEFEQKAKERSNPTATLK